MTPTSERRAQPRAALTSPVVVSVAGEQVHCAAVDVSTLGMALCGPLQPGSGASLRVEFKLGSVWHDASAVVVRETMLGGARIWGLQFLVVEDRTIAEIHAHVMKAIAETPPRRTAEYEAEADAPVPGISRRPIVSPKKLA
jgi:hypothetical protein